MPSDGLIVVEMDSVVPSQTHDQKSFSPSPAENLEWVLCANVCVRTINPRDMLRKARQQQQHNRKAKQHNTTRPKHSFFKEKLTASGGTQTHNQSALQAMLLPTKLLRQLSWLGPILYTNQQSDTQVNSNLCVWSSFFSSRNPLDPDADPDPDLEYEGTSRGFGRTHSYSTYIYMYIIAHCPKGLGNWLAVYLFWIG